VTVLDLASGATHVLSTQRTISRHLVHRAALSEVFLTDFQSVDETTFRAAAQLPPDHTYYGDHTGRPALHDPLGVFEAVRQMLLCAMHLQHDASHDTKAITAETRMEIDDPRPLLAGRGALDLELNGTVTLEKKYRETTSRVVHTVGVAVGGRHVGSVMVDTALRPADVYEGLRMGHRTTPPPYSDTLPGHVPGDAAAAHLVARERRQNVVLAAVAHDEEGLTARLHVPVAHPSMFDHPQDHVPGPVMMEAARQAVLLLAGERLGHAPAKAYLRDIQASYLRFAELDSDIVVRARPVEVTDRSGLGRPVAVTFLQDHATVATMEVGVGSTVGLEQDGVTA